MARSRQRTAPAIGAVVTTALIVAVSIGGLLTGPRAGAGSAAEARHVHVDRSDGSERLAFHDAMRKLWEDHVTWTRLFIVSFAHDLPDLGATTDRLLQNQVDIGDAVKPFYGEAAGRRLTTLLTEHITTAATLLEAAKAGDADAFDDAHDAWYANGRRIARFLHEANPDNWALRDLKQMMRDHLDRTLAEAAAHLSGDYEQDIAAYDAVHLEILHMADMLSDGIIAQFPQKF